MLYIPTQLGELMLRCGTPITLMEVVVECQRRRTPFNDFSAAGLLPTDYHGNWTDERMERRLAGLELPLPQGWRWEEESWEVDHSRRVDEHGWEYAINWPGTGANVMDLSWHSSASSLDLVRRRRHVRHRARPAAASDPLTTRLVAIDVEINPPSVLVTISDGNERPPPYLVENRTGLPLLLHQKGAPSLLRRTLQPHSRVPFVWDMPAGKRTLELCVAESSMSAEVSLDQVRGRECGGLTCARLSFARHATSCVPAPPPPRPHAPSRVQVGDAVEMDGGGGDAPRLWLQVLLHDRTRTLAISTQAPQETEATDVSQFTLAASLKGIGLSVVRSSSREIAYACLSEILIETTISSLHTRADLVISEMRLDNQMMEAQLPVVLIRSAALRPRVREIEPLPLPPCVHVSVVKRVVPPSPGAAQVHSKYSHSKYSGAAQVRPPVSLHTCRPTHASLQPHAPSLQPCVPSLPPCVSRCSRSCSSYSRRWSCRSRSPSSRRSLASLRRSTSPPPTAPRRRRRRRRPPGPTTEGWSKAAHRLRGMAGCAASLTGRSVRTRA